MLYKAHVIELSSADIGRFWSRVDQSGGLDGCWTWTGACVHGYGSFRANGTNLLAHRVAMTLICGPIPAGLEVCHACDNPPCVNYQHLFIGTHAQNQQDASIKGRSGMHRHPELTKGERNGRAKLHDYQILAIREATGTQDEIGSRFGISQTEVWRIKHRISWGHV